MSFTSVNEYPHRGLDLSKLAAESNLRIWRCDVCGQEETVPTEQEPPPCFRCKLNERRREGRMERRHRSQR